MLNCANSIVEIKYVDKYLVHEIIRLAFIKWDLN